MSFKKSFTDIKLIIFLVFAFVLLASCTSSLEPGATYASDLGNEAYPAPNAAKEIDAEIQQLESLLQQDNLSEVERNGAEDRLAEAQVLATKVFSPTPMADEVQKAYEMEQSRIAQQEIVPTPTPELGILAETSIYYEINLPRRVLVENIWQGYVDDHLVRIYAGKLLPDNRTGDKKETNHGAIYVTTQFPDGGIEHSLHITKYETGPLTIVDVSSIGKVTLVSQGFQTKASEEFFFDISEMEFAPSGREALPEALAIKGETLEAYP